MRHDMTMEAIRISQARAALSELAGPPSGGGGRSRGGGTRTGVAGPAGVSPSVPPQPTATDVRDASGSGNSWGSRIRRRVTRGRTVPGRPRPAGTARRPRSRRVRAAVPAVPRAGGARRRSSSARSARWWWSPPGCTSPRPRATRRGHALPVTHRHQGGAAASRREVQREELRGQGRRGHGVQRRPGHHGRSAVVGATNVEVRYSKVCASAWGASPRPRRGHRRDHLGYVPADRLRRRAGRHGRLHDDGSGRLRDGCEGLRGAGRDGREGLHGLTAPPPFGPCALRPVRPSARPPFGPSALRGGGLPGSGP